MHYLTRILILNFLDKKTFKVQNYLFIERNLSFLTLLAFFLLHKCD